MQQSLISVFIITLDEEARLAETIRSVTEWVDEVVVVDSGSTDKTVEIAKGFGARVIHQKWLGFGGQKRFAEEQCKNDWVLNLDADEVASSGLREEVCKLKLDNNSDPAAYLININNVYSGDTQPRPFANDYNVVRLYHLDAGRYRDHPSHDRVEQNNGVTPIQLVHPLIHFPIVDLDHMLQKTGRLASYNLEKLVQKPLWLLKLRLVFGMPLNFIKNYVFRRHIFGGWKGFVFALNISYSRNMRIAKAIEQKENDKV